LARCLADSGVASPVSEISVNDLIAPVVEIAVVDAICGDGIMSAIDFDMTMERLTDPKGDRVKISMTGKFLPYKRY